MFASYSKHAKNFEDFILGWTYSDSCLKDCSLPFSDSYNKYTKKQTVKIQIQKQVNLIDVTEHPTPNK